MRERRYYKICPGDTLYSLARANECTVVDLRKWNGIKDGEALAVGRTIMVGWQEAVKAPPVVKFPARPWKNYNNNVGQFLDNAYFNIMKAVHPGNDINGNGGGDSDFNDPVWCVTEGIVIEKTYYPVWGWMVAVDHPYFGVESIYAHLNEVHVKVGQTVDAETQIGTFGKGAGNRYVTHLHFEIRLSDKRKKAGLQRLATNFWPSTHYARKEAEQFVRENYTDGVKWIKDNGGVA